MGYKVVAISSSAAKEKFAKDLGAHIYIDGSKEDVGEALQKLGGAACIVFTAPNPKLVKPLMNGLGLKGRLLVLAPAGPVEIDLASMIQKVCHMSRVYVHCLLWLGSRCCCLAQRACSG